MLQFWETILLVYLYSGYPYLLQCGAKSHSCVFPKWWQSMSVEINRQEQYTNDTKWGTELHNINSFFNVVCGVINRARSHWLLSLNITLYNRNAHKHIGIYILDTIWHISYEFIHITAKLHSITTFLSCD